MTDRQLATKALAKDRSQTTQYAAAVIRGQVVAGPMVRLACVRHCRDLLAQKALGLVWKAEHAAHAFQFFEDLLRFTEGEHASKPFLLQPWQKFIVGSLFGWKRVDGWRRFRTAYIEIGKGNGKSPMAAGIGLYGLIADGEAGAEVYSAAATLDQAKICYRDAEHMVQGSPELAGVVDVKVNNLSMRSTNSFLRPISAEKRGLDGKRVHMALIDEIHEHQSQVVVEKIRAGTKGRRQALIIEITNSGYDRLSVCWAHHEYSRQVVEGTIDNPAWFAYVCGVDEGDDPLADEASWIKANPNLGVSIHHEYLRELVNEAVGMPAKAGIVRRLNFCQWTNQRTRYLDMDRWRACGSRVASEDLVGVDCHAGLDLGTSDDFAAFARVWLLDDGSVAVRMRYWIPESAVERHPDRPYAQWAEEGRLVVTEGEVTDLDRVEDEVSELCRDTPVKHCAYDPRNAEQMRLHLEGAGVTMIKTPQGYGLSEAMIRLGDYTKKGSLCHANDPILAWMADNAVARHGTQQDLRPDKERSADKIDGIVALIMAIDVAMKDVPAPPSIYETRGLLTV